MIIVPASLYTMHPADYYDGLRALLEESRMSDMYLLRLTSDRDPRVIQWAVDRFLEDVSIAASRIHEYTPPGDVSHSHVGRGKNARKEQKTQIPKGDLTWIIADACADTGDTLNHTANVLQEAGASFEKMWYLGLMVNSRQLILDTAPRVLHWSQFLHCYD
ncbi:hypothetical protein HYT92_01710 [Candidatus Pacearchaeota archaeon]|nr:hypothetical protein [Candidatus Pacearchaeota archaeon]